MAALVLGARRDKGTIIMNANAELTSMDSTCVGTAPIMDCSIAQVLRMRHSKGFRKPFIDNPYLEQVTLRQILSGPLAISDFLQRCRGLPHCGETTITRLLAVIESAAADQDDQNAGLRRHTTR